MFRVQLNVSPKPGIRDPQGDAVAESLRGLGYKGFRVHHVGRTLSFDLEGASEAAVRETVDDMCRRLLVNPNLETYEVAVEKVG